MKMQAKWGHTGICVVSALNSGRQGAPGSSEEPRGCEQSGGGGDVEEPLWGLRRAAGWIQGRGSECRQLP